jgi:ATP-binding cassette subfamily C protein
VLLPDIQLAKAVQIGRRIGLGGAHFRLLLLGYCAVTVVGALLDGVGMVTLIGLITGEYLKAKPDPVTATTIGMLRDVGLDPSAGALLAVSGVLIAAKIACNILIDVADAWVLAHTRLQMQRQQLRGVLGAPWEELRNRRAGKMTASMIEETALACKYVVAAVRGIYFVLSALVFGLIAMAVSAELTMLLAFLGIPVVLALRGLFNVQTRLSNEQTQVRQGLAADLAERLGSLFQIKVEGNEAAHHERALRRAPAVAKLEVRIGLGFAVISSTNGILLLVGMAGFYGWSVWRGIPLNDAFALLASVGIVGSKAATHANNAVATIGNLTRLGGSVVPIHELMFLQPEPARKELPGEIQRVELEDASYPLGLAGGLRSVALKVAAGDPLAIRGPSGSGKTTLANLISGVYLPASGTVWYFARDGARYDSRTWKARVGYVPQEISLFHGTIRENLQPGEVTLPDADLLALLNKVGAGDFVAQAGGLDAVLLEGGRSLSGGERRRLGIARVLAQRPHMLVLDEVMNGLDEQLKAEIGAVIQALSGRMVVLAITHDPYEYLGWREWSTVGRAPSADS